MKVKIQGLVYAELKCKYDTIDVENFVCDVATKSKWKIQLWKNGWIMSLPLAYYCSDLLNVKSTFEVTTKQDAKMLWESDLFSSDVLYNELLPQIKGFFRRRLSD